MTDTELHDLDAEIHRRVMGRVAHADRRGINWYDSTDFSPVPHYSTDIAAAWAVVERMVESHMFRMDDDAEGRWIAAFTSQAGVRGEHHHASAPLAICRAALKAMSEDTR